MKCTAGVCDKRNASMSLDISNAIVPAECEIGALRSIFGYFEHRAPNIDSNHSPLLEYVSHEKVLHEMIGTKGEYVFLPHNKDIQALLTDYSLSGNELCNRCKRFVCKRMPQKAKREPTRAETDLECLLRHLRNSLAHGHVYISHGGNYISVCFEDMNEKKHTTARILVNQAQLKKWKNTLERAMKEQEERNSTS